MNNRKNILHYLTRTDAIEFFDRPYLYDDIHDLFANIIIFWLV